MAERRNDVEEEAAALEAADPKFETAVFGREVEYFINEDAIGRFLVARARTELERAKEELLKVAPEDIHKIREIQSRAGIAQSVREWLAEAVRDGQQAADLIQQQRDGA